MLATLYSKGETLSWREPLADTHRGSEIAKEWDLSSVKGSAHCVCFVGDTVILCMLFASQSAFNRQRYHGRYCRRLLQQSQRPNPRFVRARPKLRMN